MTEYVVLFYSTFKSTSVKFLGTFILMLVVACVKQVPDTTQVKVDPVTGTLIREGVPFIMNPYDTHALEESLPTLPV